jgi:hypothetical protein
MDLNDSHVFPHFFSLSLEMEVRASLVGSGNMISICTCLTQLDQNFVQSFGVFLLDHILLIVLRYMSDEPTVIFFFISSSVLTPFFLDFNQFLSHNLTFFFISIPSSNYVSIHFFFFVVQ